MRIVRGGCTLLVTGFVAVWSAPMHAEDPAIEKMRQELKATQAELRQLKDGLKAQQEMMKKQQQLIDELRKETKPSVVAARRQR